MRDEAGEAISASEEAGGQEAGGGVIELSF